MSPESVGEIVCVLFHEPNTEPPVRLCRALGKKGIRIRTCTDPYTALSALCRNTKRPGISLNILLLTEPAHLHDAVELVQLAGVYAPKSVCWMYTGGPAEQVREVRPADLEAWRDTDSGEDESQPIGGLPSLRIAAEMAERPQKSSVSDDPRGGTVRTEAGPEPEEPGAVLTDDELSMLLADDSGEHERNGGHG